MTGALEDQLHSIEDYVLVEDKIVTYKWISKALKVHTNTAKKLLHAFTLKEELKEKLLVTYLIIGQEKDDSGLNISVVEKENVNEVIKNFEKVLSQHVYSIQRRSPFNANDLYNADCSYELNEEDKKLCSIRKNEDIVKRSKVTDSTTIATSSSDNSSNTSLKKSEKTVNGNILAEPKLVQNTKSSEQNHTVETEKCPTPPKKSTASSPTKSTAVGKGKKSPKKLKNAVSQGASIGTFFSKQAANAANKKKEAPSVSTTKQEEEIDEAKENIDVQVTNPSEKNNILPTRGKSTPLNKKTKVNSKKRKKHAKEYETSNKRRKRIVVASDSESSNSEMDVDDEEEERELSPEPELAPVSLQESDEEIIPPTPVEKGRKRIRKQIDKTFTGEEGFILTKKEFVYVSCSDDDESACPSTESNHKEKVNKEIESASKNKTHDDHRDRNLFDERKSEKVKKKSKSPKKTSKLPQQQRKQQSITNFFKKS